MSGAVRKAAISLRLILPFAPVIATRSAALPLIISLCLATRCSHATAAPLDLGQHPADPELEGPRGSNQRCGRLALPVANLTQIEDVDRRHALGLGLLQGALQFLGAGAARAHEHHAADGEGESDNHARWRIVDEANKEAGNRRWPDHR